jgi:hypothetical protein
MFNPATGTRVVTEIIDRGSSGYGYAYTRKKPQVVVRSVSVDGKERKKKPRVRIETLENGNGEINLRGF